MSSALIHTTKISDRFGNTVLISVRSATPDDQTKTQKLIEESAARLLAEVRKPASTTHITART